MLEPVNSPRMALVTYVDALNAQAAANATDIRTKQNLVLQCSIPGQSTSSSNTGIKATVTQPADGNLRIFIGNNFFL